MVFTIAVIGEVEQFRRRMLQYCPFELVFKNTFNVFSACRKKRLKRADIFGAATYKPRDSPVTERSAAF